MKRVLVVEDEPGIALVVEDSLRLEGLEVEVVSNGLAAGQRALEGNFDLILLDGMLPGKDGFEICRELRRAGGKTPVIFLSARSQVADRIRGLDVGANDYVVKPFSPGELMARVRRHLQHEQEVRDNQRDLELEMRAAYAVQQRLLPQVQPLVPGFEYAAVCQPAREVSGDCYDFIGLDKGKLGLLVADVCGKGMPAALLSAALLGAIRAYSPPSGFYCGEVLARVNRLLFETTAPERYATAFYGVYDSRSRTLTYANAAQYAPWVMRGSAAQRLNSLTPPLGLFAEIEADDRTIRLEPGDWLLVFSDGVPEAHDAEDREFGDERIAALLKQRSDSALRCCHSVLAAVAAFSSNGVQPGDDLTVLSARVF